MCVQLKLIQFNPACRVRRAGEDGIQRDILSSASYKMFRRGIEILIHGFNYFKFLFMFSGFLKLSL